MEKADKVHSLNSTESNGGDTKKPRVPKPKFENANSLPIDAEGRTYHVGTKKGEVAPRIVTVGDPIRAHRLATHLEVDGRQVTVSKRGFTTITGKFRGVPVSIVAIGMGISMMDFFLRETRAVVDGPMVVVRFGSCGSLGKATIGQIVVASEGAFLISRNYDYFIDDETAEDDHSKGEPYNLSKLSLPDPDLSALLVKKVQHQIGNDNVVTGIDATADSFYASQGRYDPNFEDGNSELLTAIKAKYPEVQTLEMETFTLFHLANCSEKKTGHKIHVAGCHMVFAERNTNKFISAAVIDDLEEKGGLAVLETLISFPLKS
ncbi:hypothetical protein HK102_000045 [Quaeritorhiza haematococci]|nr:hypothetical protein HK102_000045 [Quaeritorhiza haematococci]